MAQYPPPPTSDQHYSAIFPSGATSAGAQELLDSGRQDHLQYSNLNQPIYPKAESSSHGDAPSTQQHMQSLAQELQHHAALEEQQRQQIQHAAQRIQHQTGPGQPTNNLSLSQPQPQQPGADPGQKTNRLRKACDSCSIRKVKVGLEPTLSGPPPSPADDCSATKADLHVVRAPLWIFPVPLRGLVGAEGLRTDTQKLSNGAGWRMVDRLISLARRHRPHLRTRLRRLRHYRRKTRQLSSRRSRFVPSRLLTFSSMTSSPTSTRSVLSLIHI